MTSRKKTQINFFHSRLLSLWPTCWVEFFFSPPAAHIFLLARYEIKFIFLGAVGNKSVYASHWLSIVNFCFQLGVGYMCSVLPSLYFVCEHTIFLHWAMPAAATTTTIYCKDENSFFASFHLLFHVFHSPSGVKSFEFVWGSRKSEIYVKVVIWHAESRSSRLSEW